MKNIARHIGKTVLAAAFFAIPLIADCQSSKDLKYLNEPAAEEGKAEEMAAEKKDSVKREDDHFDGTICTETGIQPSFPGGMKALNEYI